MFFLADQLHKTPGEIRDLPADDYVGLCNWFEVKGVMRDLDARTQANRSG